MAKTIGRKTMNKRLLLPIIVALVCVFPTANISAQDNATAKRCAELCDKFARTDPFASDTKWDAVNKEIQEFIEVQAKNPNAAVAFVLSGNDMLWNPVKFRLAELVLRNSAPADRGKRLLRLLQSPNARFRTNLCEDMCDPFHEADDFQKWLALYFLDLLHSQRLDTEVIESIFVFLLRSDLGDKRGQLIQWLKKEMRGNDPRYLWHANIMMLSTAWNEEIRQHVLRSLNESESCPLRFSGVCAGLASRLRAFSTPPFLPVDMPAEDIDAIAKALAPQADNILAMEFLYKVCDAVIPNGKQAADLLLYLGTLAKPELGHPLLEAFFAKAKLCTIVKVLDGFWYNGKDKRYSQVADRYARAVFLRLSKEAQSDNGCGVAVDDLRAFWQTYSAKSTENDEAKAANRKLLEQALGLSPVATSGE